MSIEAQLPFEYSCDAANIAGLKPDLLQNFCIVAEAYQARTGQRLKVTSGRRSLRHTASLMADFSMKQLEGMYCQNGYPSYIREIGEVREKTGRMLTVDETYQILKDRKEGYISTHLFGAAVDVASTGLLNQELLKTLLTENGFRTLDESSLGINCIHATFTAIPKEIVRE